MGGIDPEEPYRATLKTNISVSVVNVCAIHLHVF